MRYYLNDQLLINTPMGWKDDEINILRNDFGGIYREVTQELTFIKDGAELIRRAFYSGGVDVLMTFKVERYDKLRMEYIEIFSGRLDFQTMQDNRVDGVNITAIDSSISAKVRNAENQEFAVDYDDTAENDLEMGNTAYSGLAVGFLSGTELEKSAVDMITETDIVYMAFSSGNDRLFKDVKQSISSYTNKIGEGYPLFLYDVEIGDTTQNFAKMGSSVLGVYGEVSLSEAKIKLGIHPDLWATEVAYEKGVIVEIFLAVRNSFLSPLDIRHYLIHQENAEFGSLAVAISGSIYVMGYCQIEIDPASLTYEFGGGVINAGDEIGLFCRVFVENSRLWNDASVICNLGGLTAITSVKTTNILPTFEIKCLNAKSLFTKLAEKIGVTNIKSDYLDTFSTPLSTTENYILFTSGEALRKLTDPKLKISFSTFFETINNLYGASMGIEVINGIEYLSIEDKYYFHDESKLYHLGIAKEVNITPINHITSLELGYRDNTYDELNGRTEFNSRQTWKLPLTNIEENKEDKITNVRADSTGIIKTYVDGVLLSSGQDKDTDNEVFVVDGSGKYVGESELDTYTISREKWDTITGVDFPNQMFNYEYSPKRCILRNGEWLKQYLFANSGNIELTSYDKNVSITTKKTNESVAIVENANISSADLTDSKFLPFYFDVKIAQTIDIHIALEQSKEGGLMSFEWKGNTFYGYMEEMQVRSYDKGEVSVRLIASSLTDENNLII